MGCKQGTGCIQSVSESGMRIVHIGPLQSNQEALACNKIEIDWKIRGLGPSGPRSTS